MTSVSHQAASVPPAPTGFASRVRAYWTGGLAVLLVGTVAISLCSVFYVHEISQLERNMAEREASRVRALVYLFKRDLYATASDLRFLANGDGLRAYLAAGQPADLQRAVHRAAFLSRETPDYDQVRFLGPDGREIFRINRGGVIVPGAELQDKSARGYFAAASNLPAGQVYLSTFDLNIEHGVIERPLNPVLRFAMPVFDNAGRFRGVYVINCSGANLLGRLQQFVPAFSNRLRVLNPLGYWIKAAHPKDEWGFMFPDRRGRTLAVSDPVFWREVLQSPQGQERHDGGLFTWRRFNPAKALGINPGAGTGADPFFIIGSEISADEWSAAFASRQSGFIVVLLTLGGLLAATAVVLRSRDRARQERDRFFTLTRDMLCIAGFDGYFKRLNPAWSVTLGYSETELRAKPFIEFVHPDDRESTVAESAKLAAGGETIAFENRYLAKSGSYHWLSWNARALLPEHLILASARDITDRKSSEDQIRKLNHDLQIQNVQLESANKELESFSYSVSHDLRAPLRHIDGFASLLGKQAGTALDAKGRHYLDTIAESARRMGRLIDDLLAFSRMGRTEMKPGLVDHAQLVAGAVREGRHDRDTRIEWRITPLPPVCADPAMLRLVWANLIDNAVKYSARSEPPRIEIGRLEPAGGDAAGEQVFFIRDNGVGFDMNYSANLFGVFQRLHSASEFEGTGIGLANVRRIVARHGGRAWAEGRVGQGATFFFSLPDDSTPVD